MFGYAGLWTIMSRYFVGARHSYRLHSKMHAYLGKVGGIEYLTQLERNRRKKRESLDIKM